MSHKVSGKALSPHRRGSSGGPAIHVSDQNGGEDNPAFEDDQHVGASLNPFDTRGSSRLSFRRASYDPSCISLLTVPSAGRRRHSVAQSQDLPTDLKHPLADEGDYDQRRGSQISIDHLYMPQMPTLYPPPRSPGGYSVQSNWSELIRLKDRKDSIGSYHSVISEQSIRSMSGISSAVSSKILNLVQRFNSRTEYFKEKTIQPPTPNSEENKSILSASTAEDAHKPRQHRLASYIPPISRASGTSSIILNPDGYFIGTGKCRIKLPKFLRRFDLRRTIDPTSLLYTTWLLIVTLAYTYNAAAVPMRAAFGRAEYANGIVVPEDQTVEVCNYVYENGTTHRPELMSSNRTGGVQFAMMNITCYNKTITALVVKKRYYTAIENDDNRMYWWMCDYLADLIYILDILLIKFRVRFVKNGLMEKDRKECLRNYLSGEKLKMDVAALLPLDILYLIPQLHYNTLLRLPRLLKIQTFWEFYDRMDASVKNAHIIRVMRTLTYMLFLIHIETCGYFAVSKYEGLGFNDWVYNGEGIAYVRCLYLATKTATSIGNNPKPKNQLEYMFMTVYWLSGVFVFAMLIGQIRDIFQAANAAKTQFRDTMDKTLGYLKSVNVPVELQDKARDWFSYNWKYQKTLNEKLLLEALPSKMQSDMAIHVHFEILSKVQLFQDCDKTLLYDLVLKLNPVLYLPGDYICLKGEIGTEMYIVMSGQVEVVGGDHNAIVFATLNEGSVFGEISLLAVGGGNRRTANVRSKGYSQLFLLSKVDFEEAMIDYPEAQKILKRKAKKLLSKNKKVEEESKIEHQEVIKSREGTPKMIKTVVEVLKPDSKIHEYFKRKFIQDQKEHAANENEENSEVDEDDEILIVEQIERPVSEAELKKYAERSVKTPSPVHEMNEKLHPTMTPISEDSLSAQVEAILEPTPPPFAKGPSGSNAQESTYNSDKNDSRSVVVSIENDDEDEILNKNEHKTKVPIYINPQKGVFRKGRIAPTDDVAPKQPNISNMGKGNILLPQKQTSITVLDPSALEQSSKNEISHKPLIGNDGNVSRSSHPGRLIKSNKVGVTNLDKNKTDAIIKSDSVAVGTKSASTSSFDKGSKVITVSEAVEVQCNIEVHQEDCRTPSPKSLHLGFINKSFDA